MALIKCNECKKEISDQAEACPHCGSPVKKEEFYSEEEQEICVVKHDICYVVITIIGNIIIPSVVLWLDLIMGLYDYSEMGGFATFCKWFTFILYFIALIRILYSIYEYKKEYLKLSSKRVTGYLVYGYFQYNLIDYPLRQIDKIEVGKRLFFSYIRINVASSWVGLGIVRNAEAKAFQTEYTNLIENKYKYQ